MQIFIFIGPTISEAECNTLLNAVYLPPVSQGDVASLLRFHPDVIGIVDGYFDQVPSVWHKEILLALSQGVRVVGAASMGALRAAELHPFGMEGVGRIFEWYRDGIIDADDEVALRHAPVEFDYIPLSEALVNIRATLEAARHTGVATEEMNKTIIDAARVMPYWKRTLPAIFDAGAKAGLELGALAKLKDYWDHHRIDQKKKDAIALLRYIATLDPAPHIDVNFTVQATNYLDELLDADVRLGLPGDQSQPTVGELTDFARLANTDFSDSMRKVGERQLRLALANQLGVRASISEIENEKRIFQEHHCIETEENLRDWLARNASTEEELQTHLESLALESKVCKMFSVSDNREVLWQLRDEKRFESLLAAWHARNEEILADDDEVKSQDELFLFYKQLMGDRSDATLAHAAQHLGFYNISNMLAELLRAKQYFSSRDPNVNTKQA